MMKRLTILLLFSGMILWAGCGSGSTENGELPPPEEFDWPWLKTGRTLDLPVMERAEDIPGGTETNMISIKAGTERPYHLVTTNTEGEAMERSFELRDLRAVLRDAQEHHGLDHSYSEKVIIAAEKNASGQLVSDLIGAFSHIGHTRFNFQVAYPEGFEPDERFFDQIPYLSLMFPPMDADGFTAHRREQGADFYLTKEEIKALEKPKKVDKTDVDGLPPPPSLDSDDLPPPPRRAAIRFKYVYPGSSTEMNEGALYVRLVDGTTLEVGGKPVPLREFSQTLKELFPDINSSPPIVMSFAPDAAWGSVVEMINVLRELQVRKYALYTPEHEAYIEYMKAHPELEEEPEDLW